MTMKIELNTVYNMDCLKGLRKMPDNFVDCCVTSPPYFGLRDYGTDGQIGLEKSPKELIEPCVLAGCPNDGIVLDPFMGTGTTAMVARLYHRNFVGFELNSEYMEIINKKIVVTPKLF